MSHSDSFSQRLCSAAAEGDSINVVKLLRRVDTVDINARVYPYGGSALYQAAKGIVGFVSLVTKYYSWVGIGILSRYRNSVYFLVFLKLIRYSVSALQRRPIDISIFLFILNELIRGDMSRRDMIQEHNIVSGKHNSTELLN